MDLPCFGDREGMWLMTPTNDDFFCVMGKISIYYSNLDFFFTKILDILLSDNPRIGPVISDQFNSIERKLELIQMLAPLRITDASLMARLLDSLKAFSPERPLRNRIIHDMWEFKEDMIKQGKIRRLKYSGLSKQKDTKWQEHIHSLASLQEVSNRLMNLVTQLLPIVRDLQMHLGVHPTKKPMAV